MLFERSQLDDFLLGIDAGDRGADDVSLKRRVLHLEQARPRDDALDTFLYRDVNAIGCFSRDPTGKLLANLVVRGRGVPIENRAPAQVQADSFALCVDALDFDLDLGENELGLFV